MAGFSPEVFKWARESAGLTLDDAAHTLKIKGSTLEAVEGGTEPPSRPLLLKMAKAYRRSLLSLYLPAPPRKGDRGEDFRTVNADRTVGAEASIDALVRHLRARQSLVRSTLEDDEDSHPVEFVGSIDLNAGVPAVAKSIETSLGISRDEFRKQRNSEQAFTFLRGKVEEAGVFVLLIGNLGSHHSTIPVETFRGFAIADKVAPFIVINDQDAKTAWSFTLLHELTHIWLGATGVSGGYAEQKIERFCNAVAAEILIPSAEVALLKVADFDIADQIAVISKQATEWKVSRQMLAYGLLRVGNISQAAWQAVDSKLREMWMAERQREKETRKSEESQPSYYVVRRHRLGHAMLTFASRSINAGTLSPAKAAQVLGVKPRSVFPLLSSTASAN